MPLLVANFTAHQTLLPSASGLWKLAEDSVVWVLAVVVQNCLHGLSGLNQLVNFLVLHF